MSTEGPAPSPLLKLALDLKPVQSVENNCVHELWLWFYFSDWREVLDLTNPPYKAETNSTEITVNALVKKKK